MKRIQTASKALRQSALRLHGDTILIKLIGDLDKEIGREIKRQQKREAELQEIFKSLPYYMGGIMTEHLEKLLKQIEETAANSDQSLVLGALLFQLRSEIAGSSGSVSGDKPVQVQKVDYGKGGYTDANDPRAENARRHGADGQPVDACWLIVHADPAKQYRCKSVRVIGEMEAGGKHIVTVTGAGSNDVILATGYNGSAGSYDQRIVHTPGQELVLDGHGQPPNLGSYAVFLQRNGEIVSDEVGSLMLPFGHHIGAFIEFAER